MRLHRFTGIAACPEFHICPGYAPCAFVSRRYAARLMRSWYVGDAALSSASVREISV